MIVIGGIQLGSKVYVRPASECLRDMYDGAVVVAVVADDSSVYLELTAPDALALADDLREAAGRSTEDYDAAQARRREPS